VRRVVFDARDPDRDLVIIFVLLRVVPGNIVDILFDAAGFVDPADKANLEKDWASISADLCAIICTGSAGCCTAISAIPYVSESRRCRRFCRGFRSLHRLAASHSCSPPRSAFPGRHQRRPSGLRLDYTLSVVSLSGLSLPSFWLGLLILMASVSLFGSMPIYNPNPKTWTEAFAIYAVPAMRSAFAARR